LSVTFIRGPDIAIGANFVAVPRKSVADCVSNVMAHVQTPDFVFRRNGLHLNRRGGGGGGQFNRQLAAEVCANAVVMLDTPRSEVV
jgi:hypothetical protein